MPITTGSHPKNLWPGVHDFFGMKYKEHPEEWRELFEERQSGMNYEEIVESVGFGLVPVKDEARGVDYATTRQGWLKRFRHVTFGLGYIVTQEEQEDNLYGSKAFDRARSLAFSCRQTKENVHANHINRATSGSYLGGDGVALMSTSHPSEAGNWSNLLAPAADLSEVALEDVGIMVYTFTDDKGLKIAVNMLSLHIHPNDWFEAHRIIKSVLQNDTANNAINALKATNALPGGIKMNHYFTDTDQWGVKTDVENGFLSFTRRARDFKIDMDFDTGNIKHKSTERYISGWADPRCWCGSPGA